jgi:hypothetical protein
MQGGAVEVPGQEGLEVFGGGFGLLADVFVVGEEAFLDEALDAAAVEGAEAAGEVAEAEQRVAADMGVAVPCEVGAGALGPFAAFGLERHVEHQALELDGVVAFERVLVAPVKLCFAFVVHGAGGYHSGHGLRRSSA